MSDYAMIYEGGHGYDIIAPDPFGYYQILAFKSEWFKLRIRRERIDVGEHTFIPGNWYRRFGHTKKKSAAFIHYDGDEIRFEGTYGMNALFCRSMGPFSFKGYPACYWSWRFSFESKAFFATTRGCAGRVMEM